MADFLRVPFDEFTRRFVRKVGNKYSLVEKFNYDCTFLTRDKTGNAGCMVYGARPMQCRTWPFWSENLKTPANWQKAAGRCPGMCDGEAPRFELEHIEACRQHPETP